MTEKNIDELRLRRIKLAKDRELNLLREEHGERLADALSVVARRRLVLADFSFDASPSPKVLLSEEYKSQKLSISYLDSNQATQIATCAERAIPVRSGHIGIYGNEYLGFCYVVDCSIPGMVAAAHKLNETIVIYLDEAEGVVVVDCYPGNRSGDFSISIHGVKSASLDACFKKTNNGVLLK